MPIANLDGIETYYETYGSGTPILMCAPGGFDATIDKWRVASAWTGIDAFDALGAEHIVDRLRPARVWPVGRAHRTAELGEVYQTWQSAARSFEDRLGVDHGRLHGLLGGFAFGVHYPEATRGLILHWPVGGYRWKVNSQARFMRHYDFAKQHGLTGVIERPGTRKIFGRTRKQDLGRV